MNPGKLLMGGRAAAEALMIDRCRIERPGEPVTDPETGAVTPSYTLVYPLPGQEAPLDGRCKVQQTMAQSRSAEAGGAVFTVLDTRLDIPIGVGPIAVDDRVTMLTGVYNPALIGNAYRITEPFEKSIQTAQRLRVEELA